MEFQLSQGQKWYVTEIKAMHPVRKELATFGGPNVPGISVEDAQNFCNENIGYCKVLGELVAEIPCIKGTYEPDWSGQINYDVQNN